LKEGRHIKGEGYKKWGGGSDIEKGYKERGVRGGEQC